MKKLFLAFLCIYSISANAELVSLEKYTKNNDWISNPSDLAYVCTRCASLMSILEGVSKGSINKQSQENLKLQAAFYLEFSQLISSSAGMSDQAYLDRIKSITDFYTANMMESKSLNNTFFSDFVSSDFEICVHNISKVVELVDKKSDATRH